MRVINEESRYVTINAGGAGYSATVLSGAVDD
jgi:hypothetical protein